MAHAKLSPSSSARWTKCALAPSLEDGREDTTSKAAMRGTIAHDIAAKELTNATVRLDDLRGRFGVVRDDGSAYFTAAVEDMPANAYLVDDEIAGWVTSYVTLVRELVSKGNGTLHVEVSVPIDHITDEEGATGTSDVVIEFPDGEWLVVDLKTGSNRVNASRALDPVSEKGFASIGPRKPNTQLVMYASGALRELDVFDSAKRVRLMIVQPSLSHVDEHAMEMNEFVQWVSWIKSRADETRLSNPTAQPDYDTCLYCKAKSDCKPRAEFVLKTIAPTADGFEDLTISPSELEEGVVGKLVEINTDLSVIYPQLDFIEKWVKDQRERAAKAVTAGEVIRFENGKVLGYVPGKKGSREWLGGAEEKLKSFGLKKDEMYDQTLISPAKAEELLLGGEKPSKVRWERLQPFIGQKEGKPKLAMIDPPEQDLEEVQPADQPVVAEPVLTIDDNDLF